MEGGNRCAHGRGLVQIQDPALRAPCGFDSLRSLRMTLRSVSFVGGLVVINTSALIKHHFREAVEAFPFDEIISVLGYRDALARTVCLSSV